MHSTNHAITTSSAPGVTPARIVWARRLLVIVPVMLITYVAIPFVWGRTVPEETVMPRICGVMPAWTLFFRAGWESSGKPGKPRWPYTSHGLTPPN
ncbi:MAG: hypothetical protein HEQ23_09850 [Tepidisphaera sp.]